MSIANLSLSRIVPTSLSKWLDANLASHRTRVLLIMLGATLAVGGLMVLDAIDSAMLRRIAERQYRLVRIEQLESVDTWRQRRDETDPLRVQAEARLWEAETDGLAQANFQSWIIEQASAAGISPIDVRTTINSTTNNAMKLRQLSAQVSGRFEPQSFFRLLQAIADRDRLVIVDRLELQTLPVPHFEMLLGTFLRPARTT
jgi:hypothetical protein